MSEANLWEWLRDVALPLGQYSRIESGDTSPGFPDVHAQVGPSGCFTIELKFAKHPDARIPFTKKHGMRRSQIKWIRENLRQGGVVWIIAEVTPHIYILDGHHADKINGATHEQINDLAEHIIYKKAPETAAKILAKLLKEE